MAGAGEQITAGQAEQTAAVQAESERVTHPVANAAEGDQTRLPVVEQILSLGSKAIEFFRGQAEKPTPQRNPRIIPVIIDDRNPTPGRISQKWGPEWRRH